MYLAIKKPAIIIETAPTAMPTMSMAELFAGARSSYVSMNYWAASVPVRKAPWAV